MASVKLSECICPICLCILVEPVTMPCMHELCMPCFRQNVEQANLTCPMCRLRISNWARKHSGRLINEERWRTIREAFPALCQKRMETGEEGEDDVLDLMTQPPPPVIHVAEPGEIGEEFKKESEKRREEYRREQEEAVRQSEEYIRELQKEEVKRFEERREELLSQEKQDAELARRIAKEGPNAVIHLGEKVHVIREQVLKDEELARRIQMSEQSLSNTPIPKSPDIVILSSSGSSSRKNTGSSSTMKCLSIEKFLSPVGRKSKSPPTHRVSWEGVGLEDQPSTSALSPDTIELTDSPSPDVTKTSTRPHGAFSPVVLKAPRLRELDDSHLRAHSTDSNDSISGEMNHFKPIHVSPRTAHKKLPDGRAASPPIVFTTPRNLQKLEEGQGGSSVKMSSILKARWRDLEAERTNQVNESSKSTMTSLTRQLKKPFTRPPTFSKQHARRVGEHHGSRQGEPPQKKPKVEVTAAGDAPLRIIDDNALDGSDEHTQTLLQMRVGGASSLGDAANSDAVSIPDVNESGDATDYNHNCNNSRLLDSKLNLANVEKCSSVNSEHSCGDESRSNVQVIARVSGGAGKGEDEVDGRVRPYKKKIHTPIKEYAMREQTKLQTRVTNSIKDLFNAKRSKLKVSNGDASTKGTSEPLLPSLPKTADETISRLENTLSNGGADSSDSNKSKIVSVRQRKLAFTSRNTTKSANGRDSAHVNQRSSSRREGSRSKSAMEEVSYEEWLKGSECESNSMQEVAKHTGNETVNESSMCETICRDSKMNVKPKYGTVSLNSTMGLPVCDGSLTLTDREIHSTDKISSQDSDVSMASVDAADDYDSSRLKSKSNGERTGKERGKARPAKGSGSSKKSPRKSEETILRYMELLNQEQERMTQEDEDRLLAERLQREFDKEMRQREAVDRSKGTEDAYELRQQNRSLYRYLE